MFEATIDYWIALLAQYNYTTLCSKPSEKSWSLGQLYLHLIADAKFYLEQINTCLSTNENADEEAAPFARSLFENNGFPDQLIKGDPSHAWIPQPESREQLLNDLQQLKNEMLHAKELISATNYIGKTKHPGLGYFSAIEWYRFAEIHFRHHIAQQKRIDRFLKTGKYS